MEMLRDGELNFFPPGIEGERKNIGSRRGMRAASKFGDPSLTIGKKWIRILDTE